MPSIYIGPANQPYMRTNGIYDAYYKNIIESSQVSKQNKNSEL